MPHPNEAGVEYIRTSDPSSRILKKKLRKSYDIEHVNDLLCYTAGRIITPSDVILPTIAPLLSSYRHTFRRVWLMSEQQVFVVWH